MKWIKALAALLLLGAVVLGVPAMLVTFVGSPIPDGLSANMQLTDTTLVQLLSLTVWAFWAQTCWCIALEVIAALKSQRLTRTPGAFNIQTLFARTMIGLVAAAFVSVPLLPSPIHADTVQTDNAQDNTGPTPAPATTTTDDATQSTDPAATQAPTNTTTVAPAPSVVEVVVERGDTLWALAQTHLDDAERWTEIAQLNDGRTMVDGSTFASASLLRPGWVLQLPGTATPQASAPADYTVTAGDTLSQIAADQLGDADRYPEIFEASKHLDQPVPLTDPNLIYPGQLLDIPHAPPAAETPPPGQTPGVSPEQAPSPEQAAPDATAPDVLPDVLGAPGAKGGTGGAATPTPDPAPSVPADASPTPTEVGEADSASADSEADTPDGLPSWVWPSMVAGGGLLAGGLLLVLRQRRSTQRRSRRPGRVMPMPTAIAREAEQSIATAGTASVDMLVLLDQILRRTAAHLTRIHEQVPELAAVEITPTSVVLHLHDPAESPLPWKTSHDPHTWTLDRTTELDIVGPDPGDDPSPWPLLVTIGSTADGSIWLLNLEGQAIAVTGDANSGQNFARYVAAEILCNPWSRHTTLDLLGIATELALVDPERTNCPDDFANVAAEAVATAVTTVTRLDTTGDRDAPAARAASTDPDAWGSRLVIVGSAVGVDELGQLANLVESHGARTGSALLVTDQHTVHGIEIVVDAVGRLTVPAMDLRLDGVGMTASEATGCATLLTYFDATVDEPAPDLEGDDPWDELMTTTGALRDEYRIDRSTTAIEPAESVLPEADETYWAAATTTEDDLNRLAPKVSLRTRDHVADTDPGLDQDLAEWKSGDVVRPRLSLLGPVSAETAGTPAAKRRPFYTEMFAYIATRPHGATTEEVAEAFDITPARTRTDVGRLRDWLGTDPATGAKYLPDAREAPAAARRGIGVYQVADALVDLDLFRRLRARGESRGSDGIDDFVNALALVTGRPFEKLRPGGWGWMYDEVRLDQHAICAITDVAHVVVVEMLTRGETASARTAVSIALMAAPDEEMARLDLAAVLDAEGHTDEAVRLVREEICDRSDDGAPPQELTARTVALLEDHPSLLRRAQ
ncbi:MAG: LysM peptidoglycan-binding domain-containing protein [Aeromicrobium sp.]|uniref:LysM peptidoglycan-binding domain-containing protein n=1 Tax=Aeromicrobium sp. TaxID=1871063 RepID=UPI002611C887|nr:LysM peptidoglycan-binding domain-containing protein [Aeromicrobium sp.]MDF1705823.1 LysM peptidoglycan-binding domain-containing protein [Aeromicrobium sp.]